MAQKHIGQFDKKTGEELGGFVAYIAPKRVNGFRDGWLAMAQGTVAINLVTSKNIDGDALRVFLMLLACLEHENHILTPQAEMAAKMGMAKSNFSRSMKKLEKEGVIIRGPKIGRMVSFKLNPEYAWKGSAKNHVVALDAERKERMKKANISGTVDGLKQPERDEKTRDWVEEAEQA